MVNTPAPEHAFPIRPHPHMVLPAYSKSVRHSNRDSIRQTRSTTQAYGATGSVIVRMRTCATALNLSLDSSPSAKTDADMQV
jgi:hypothetical protein